MGKPGLSEADKQLIAQLIRPINERLTNIQNRLTNVEERLEQIEKLSNY